MRVCIFAFRHLVKPKKQQQQLTKQTSMQKTGSAAAKTQTEQSIVTGRREIEREKEMRERA